MTTVIWFVAGIALAVGGLVWLERWATRRNEVFFDARNWTG